MTKTVEYYATCYLADLNEVPISLCLVYRLAYDRNGLVRNNKYHKVVFYQKIIIVYAYA